MSERPIFNPEINKKSQEEKVREEAIRKDEIDMRQIALDNELAAKGIISAKDKEEWMQLNKEEYEKLSEDVYEEKITLEEFQNKLHKLINPPSI